jgi:hypothetical protein
MSKLLIDTIFVVSEQTIVDDDGFKSTMPAIKNCNGLIIDWDSIQRIIESVAPFYREVSREEIDRHNEAVMESMGAPRFNDRAEVEKDKSGYVYVVGNHDEGLYKIGMTTRTPSERVLEFSPKLPFECEIMATIRTMDARSLEREIHDLYKHKRENGEWFRLEEADIDDLIAADWSSK